MMNATTYLGKQINSMRYLQDSVLKSISGEMLTWQPPGTLTCIGLIWLHMIGGEDSFISILKGQPSLWQSGNWQEIFGLEKYPNIGEDWGNYAQARLAVTDLQGYTQAVRIQTDGYLGSITDDTLEEEIKFFPENDPKADVWALLVSHSLHHTGEIAALKGLQGEKGLPF
jgi:uncharacterized damage-inducible protein DinB